MITAGVSGFTLPGVMGLVALIAAGVMGLALRAAGVTGFDLIAAGVEPGRMPKDVPGAPLPRMTVTGVDGAEV